MNARLREGLRNMLDISEDLMTLADAARSLPTRGGKRVHVSTLHRWATDGIRGPDGEMVTLETIKLGGSTMTSQQALQRFAERLSRRKPQEPRPSQRKAIQRAKGELDAVGI